MLGRSPAMQQVFSMIRRLAPHAATILISGETGTGKELAARAFHQLGPRSSKPFLKNEVVENARGATLFLDEVGDLPFPAQGKLLRVLESDVSVIAATSRDLRAEIVAGRFRGDLFYRLTAVEVRLPPLRDRRDDIAFLASAFTAECARRIRRPLNGLTPGAEQMLLGAAWGGNVRELKNAIERACMLAEGGSITERDIEASLGPALATGQTAQARASSAALMSVERGHIVDVLRQVNGNRMAAAKILGISRRALYRRLERHRIVDIS
ncbi:MAG TPA: sigma 54-interacting transcriptional regulator [Vicinamibacterales bacterium]|nr:sigma 54-interacting transcriptional regulator [Vicinamibacterales bacterium]